MLLLQHGLGEYAERYVRRHDNLVAHLLDAGITVFAFDLWGHGHSGGARAVTDLRAALRDHAAARRLLAGEGLPVILLGHSLGAAITAASVARDPEGLAGGILLSTPLPEPRGWAVQGAINALATLAPGARAPVPAPDPAAGTRIPEAVEEAQTDPLNAHEDLTNLVAATALSTGAATWPLLGGWRVPTLILHGTDDARADPAISRHLYEAVASQDRTLRWIEGGRHSLLNDTDQDAVLREILDWLDERLSR